MKDYTCKECDSNQVSVNYSVEINPNDMESDLDIDTHYRYATTQQLLDGDYSEHVVCDNCGNTWEADNAEWMYEKQQEESK